MPEVYYIALLIIVFGTVIGLVYINSNGPKKSKEPSIKANDFTKELLNNYFWSSVVHKYKGEDGMTFIEAIAYLSVDGGRMVTADKYKWKDSLLMLSPDGKNLYKYSRDKWDWNYTGEKYRVTYEDLNTKWLITTAFREFMVSSIDGGMIEVTSMDTTEDVAKKMDESRLSIIRQNKDIDRCKKDIGYFAENFVSAPLIYSNAFRAKCSIYNDYCNNVYPKGSNVKK